MAADLADALADMLGIAPQHGDEWTILCPSPTHNDAHPSASIYVGEPSERLKGGKLIWRLPGMWICYSCGARGRVSNGQIETYEAPADRNLQVAEEMLAEMDVKTYPETWLDYFDFYDGVHPYWLSRFSEATCWKHRLGYDFDTECGTYPLRAVDGTLLGVVRRDLTGTRPWKYFYPPGADIGTLLYGYNEARTNADIVVLGEGALDAIAADEALEAMTAEDVGALAIYGSQLRVHQATLLRRLYPSRVITAFDADEAGRHAHASVVEALPDFDVVACEIPEGRDIADLTVPERISLLDQALSA